MSGKLHCLLTIFNGLTATDGSLPGWSRAWQVISRLTWELPTTIPGLLTAVVLLISDRILVQHFRGATFIRIARRPADQHSYWAFTLGTYIIGSAGSAPLLQHEYGHYLQSRLLGPFYLIVVGLPSLLSASLDNARHHTRWFERDADRRSRRYLNARV